MVGLFLGLTPFLLACLWFFAAQHGSRPGQFPLFQLAPSLRRLVEYAAANVVGGLPLYVTEAAKQPVGAFLGIGLLALAALIALRWREIGRPEPRRLLALATTAPPLGLLALGITFDSSPIELRYLCFATPFAALLAAGAIGSLRPPGRTAIVGVLIVVQALAIAGLILRPETMQPARQTARAAASLAGGGAVILPFGNDGVGIVGAFATEAPPALPLILVRPTDSQAVIRDRATPFHRVVLALLTQDDASRAAIPLMRAAFAPPDWRAVADGFNLLVVERSRDGE